MTALKFLLPLLICAIEAGFIGGCTFPESWTGSWFQSGYPGLIAINSTHIYPKGECSETESFDKFLLYDRSDDCYRCMVIHEKHKYVLQYKETYCSQKDSLASICESISGDAPLYYMFRKEPRPVPQQCPFHPAPFTFTYSRGSGDCVNPPSRAEACTDDSRLLLRYMACPDVPATESHVEELVCLATWKEGSNSYLVGQISQVISRRISFPSDEDTYRCFIYKGQHTNKTMTYNIAQSGDATCNGLSSPTDGRRTMKLTNTSDDEHNRCHFPSWIVKHHKWFSLNRTHQYHFTTKNATLKVMNPEGSFEEKRLVCHSILEQKSQQSIKLVAHVTKGCESGHMCVSFVHRDNGVMEMWSGALWDTAQDACSEPPRPHITLISYTRIISSVRGYYYKYHKERVNWADAVSTCRSEGARLFHPDSAEELEQVWRTLDVGNNGGNYLFTGLSDLDKPGDYKTVDGRPRSQVYNKWSSGEPDSWGGTRRCGALDYTTHLLYVGYCHYTHRFICKHEEEVTADVTTVAAANASYVSELELRLENQTAANEELRREMEANKPCALMGKIVAALEALQRHAANQTAAVERLALAMEMFVGAPENNQQ